MPSHWSVSSLSWAELTNDWTEELIRGDFSRGQIVSNRRIDSSHSRFYLELSYSCLFLRDIFHVHQQEKMLEVHFPAPESTLIRSFDSVPALRFSSLLNPPSLPSFPSSKTLTRSPFSLDLSVFKTRISFFKATSTPS